MAAGRTAGINIAAAPETWENTMTSIHAGALLLAALAAGAGTCAADTAPYTVRGIRPAGSPQTYTPPATRPASSPSTYRPGSTPVTSGRTYSPPVSRPGLPPSTYSPSGATLSRTAR